MNLSKDPFKAPMHIVAEVLRYIEFSPEDLDHVRTLGQLLKPVLQDISDAFYDALTTSPMVSRIFEGPEQITRLRHSLLGWLEELFEGQYDEDYYARRMRIGYIHVQVGLEPHFVSGAMNIIRSAIERHTYDLCPDPRMSQRYLSATHKVLDLELCLIHSSYWDHLLLEKLRMPQALALGLAHEIRNPLNGINLNLTLLERRLRHIEGTQALNPMIEVMRQEIKRIGNLTTEIMDFSKPIGLNCSWTPCRELVESIRGLYGTILDASQIEFITRVDAPDDRLWCDRDRIIQALTNLMNNATEALEHGGQIELELHHRGTHVDLVVRDNGKGMPPQHALKVFDLFFTSKSQGTGLGLAIVRKIIDAHQGHITLNTKEGIGAKFLITLPQPEHTS